MKKYLFSLIVMAGAIVAPVVTAEQAKNATIQTSVRDRLVGYWPLDETSGTRSAAWQIASMPFSDDTSEIGSATGKIGNAGEFIASEAADLDTADNAAISFGNEDFSIAVWCYINTGGNFTDRRIYHKGNGLGASQFSYALRFSNGSTAWRFALSDGSSATGVNATGGVSAATWYFVYAEHDATGNTIGISSNGSSITTAAWTTGCWDDSQELVLGYDLAGGYHEGRIDSLMIWRRRLTTAEIAYLYNGGTGRSPLH